MFFFHIFSPQVNHTYICDMHKDQIQSVRQIKPRKRHGSEHESSPEIDSKRRPDVRWSLRSPPTFLFPSYSLSCLSHCPSTLLRSTRFNSSTYPWKYKLTRSQLICPVKKPSKIGSPFRWYMYTMCCCMLLLYVLYPSNLWVTARSWDYL